MEERKTRSDKKVDVKPTMSLVLKRQLYEIARLSNEPVKDIAERLCVEAMTSKFIAEELCKWLRRNYYYNSTIVIGHKERPRLKLTFKGETGKVTIRFLKCDYDQLSELAYALDINPTATAAILIRLTIRNKEFMEMFVNNLNKVNERERIEVMRFLNRIWTKHQ